MPPKRKAREEPAVKLEATPSGSDSGSADQSDDDLPVALDVARELAQQRGEFNDDEVVDQASVFMTLPTESLLAVVVGVCSRLQAAVSPLTLKPGMIGHGVGGQRRLHQDALRVLVAARRALTPAINALLAAEIALADAKDSHAALLARCDAQ